MIRELNERIIATNSELTMDMYGDEGKLKLIMMNQVKIMEALIQLLKNQQ
jgi:hypothetical protein